MNTRPLAIGVLGGLLASATLLLPLYKVLPTAYSSTWPGVSPHLGTAGYVLAVLVALASGYSAARWGWASSQGESLKFGAVAGIVVGLLAFNLIGSGAAGVAGDAPILLYGPKPTTGKYEMSNLLADALIRIMWWTHLCFFIMCGLGAILGALGGGIYGQQKANVSTIKAWGRTPHSVHPMIWQSLAVFTLLLSAIAVVVTDAVLITMTKRTINSVTVGNYRPDLDPRGIHYWPMGTYLLLIILSTWWLWQQVRGWSHANKEIRINARMTGIVALLVPLAAIGMLFLLEAGEQPTFPVTVIGSTVLLVVTLAGAYTVWRSSGAVNQVADPPGYEALANPLRPTFNHALDFLLGAFPVLLSLSPLVASGLSISLGCLPFIATLTPVRTGQDRSMLTPPTVDGTMHDLLVKPFQIMVPSLLGAAVMSTLLLLCFMWLAIRLRMRRVAPADSLKVTGV